MDKLLALALLGSAWACSSYTCGNNTAGVCSLLVNNTYYLNACSSGYQCNLASSLCEAIPVELSGPGESCKTNSTCTSSYCKSSVCVGASTGQSCQGDISCNPGLYCRESVCVAQLAIGKSGCASDYQCVNDAFCDGGTCTSYFSIDNYESVDSCLTYANWRCSSGACYNTAQGPACTPALPTFSSPPIKCGSASDCISTADPQLGFRYSSNCSCSYTATPSSYCEVLPGDAVYQGLILNLQSWLSSSSVSKCNTSRRFALTCISDVWSEGESLELQYYWMWTSYFPYVQNSLSCVRSVLATEYWAAADTYNDYGTQTSDVDDYNSAHWMSLSCLLLTGLL
jgi:hypothetical protein